jgi:hypothetical protein
MPVGLANLYWAESPRFTTNNFFSSQLHMLVYPTMRFMRSRKRPEQTADWKFESGPLRSQECMFPDLTELIFGSKENTYGHV